MSVQWFVRVHHCNRCEEWHGFRTFGFRVRGARVPYGTRVQPDWFVTVGGDGVRALMILVAEYKSADVAFSNTQDLYV